MRQNPVHTRHGWWANRHMFGKSGSDYSGHVHPEFEIGRLLSGTATLVHAGQQRQVEAGEVLLWWGGLPHGYHPGPDCAGLFWLTVPLEDWLNWGVTPSLTSALLAGEVIALERQLWSEQRFGELQRLFAGDETQLRIAQYECAASLLRWSRGWLSGTMQTSQQSGGLADKVMAVLPELVPETIDMPQLAKRFHVNPRAMMTAFKRRYGLTIGAYLRALRLAHAAGLLLRTDFSVLDIATQCGFTSQSRFYASFGEYYGMSPGAFRRLGGSSVQD